MKIIYSLLISLALIGLLLFSLSGCSRELESETIGYDLPVEPPVPFGLNLTLSPETVSLTWSVSDTVAGMSFNVYYSDSLAGDYTSWDITTEFNSTITGLNPGRLYYFKVASILPSGLESNSSDISTTVVGVLSTIINGGDMFSSSRNVLISFITPVPISLLQLSEDSTFAGVDWETYSPTKAFELSSGDGIKYVYSRFQFNNGSVSDSVNSVLDSIILDTESQIDSVYFGPSEITFAEDSIVTFYVVTSEAGGEASVTFPGLSNYDLDYDLALSDSLADRHVYSRAYEIPANLEVVDIPITGYFVDAAGNSAPIVNSNLGLNISNPPKPITLTVVAETSSQIRLTWSIATDNDFSAYQIYRGTDNAVSNSSDPITVINNRNSLSYTDSGLDEDTEYFYVIYVYDNTALFAPSNIESDQTLVNVAPSPVDLAGRIEVIETDEVAVLSWTANEDNDFGSYRVYQTRNPADTVDFNDANLFEIINDQSVTTFNDILPDIVGNFFYNIVVFDQQDMTAQSNWIVVSK